MLQQFIPMLIKDFELDDTNLAGTEPGTYTLPLDDFTIHINEIPNGFSFKADIAAYPKVQGELFATDVMLANLFGQGTHGAVLGLSPNGETLRLSRVIDYPIEYKEFRGILEDFINAVDYWQSEALNTK